MPQDYIDTQGLSPKMSPEETAKWKERGGDKQKHKPMQVKPRRMHTPQLVKELKILINEVLDEREYNKRMRGSYDIGGYELPPSYFDLNFT